MFIYLFITFTVSEDGSVPKIKSYELVTEELVLQALWNDKGQNAKVLSWEIKEFTNKGDGYMSVVASIVVRIFSFSEYMSSWSERAFECVQFKINRENRRISIPGFIFWNDW